MNLYFHHNSVHVHSVQPLLSFFELQKCRQRLNVDTNWTKKSTICIRKKTTYENKNNKKIHIALATILYVPTCFIGAFYNLHLDNVYSKYIVQRRMYPMGRKGPLERKTIALHTWLSGKYCCKSLSEDQWLIKKNNNPHICTLNKALWKSARYIRIDDNELHRGAKFDLKKRISRMVIWYCSMAKWTAQKFCSKACWQALTSETVSDAARRRNNPCGTTGIQWIFPSCHYMGLSL